jgi:hypothetical protein
VDTVGFDNSGQRHHDDQVDYYTSPQRSCVYRDIDGDLTAWFCRADLDLRAVTGRVDVKNEFGDTRLTITKPLAEKPHRVVSESGRVVVLATVEALNASPLLALTQCGSVEVGVKLEQTADTNITVQMGSEYGRRSWQGLWTKRDQFGDFQRPKQILDGEDRTPGLDLISISGTVVFAPAP